jgi:spectrin alpha
MEYNLEQQIEQKNASGVSDERLQEIVEIFRTFDRDGSGELDRNEIKSCLRASGMNLPLVEEGEPEPEFESVLKQMDPDGSGKVDLGEFKAYMISKETTNVESSQDVGNAFSQAANNKPYITKAELYGALDEAQAEYCIRNMKPYVDDKGIEVGGAYDYLGFVNILFAS